MGLRGVSLPISRTHCPILLCLTVASLYELFSDANDCRGELSVRVVYVRYVRVWNGVSVMSECGMVSASCPSVEWCQRHVRVWNGVSVMSECGMVSASCPSVEWCQRHVRVWNGVSVMSECGMVSASCPSVEWCQRHVRVWNGVSVMSAYLRQNHPTEPFSSSSIASLDESVMSGNTWTQLISWKSFITVRETQFICVVFEEVNARLNGPCLNNFSCRLSYRSIKSTLETNSISAIPSFIPFRYTYVVCRQ